MVNECDYPSELILFGALQLSWQNLSIYFNIIETVMAMHRSEQLIYQRRAQQQKLSTLQTKLRQEFHEKEFARWQNRGTDVQKANEMRQRLKQLRDASTRNLNARRQELALQLEKEQAQYQRQIVGGQETPEQIRSRMAERVKQLKEERQNQRKDYVSEQLYRRFEMNADELRKVDAELRELKTDYQRNVQLIEKQNIMENQYEEEMLFAELGRRELKKKEEKEREKIREQQQKVQQRNAILAIQKEMKDQKIKKQKEMTEAERQMLKDEWERDKQMQRLRDLELQGKSKDIAKDLIESNQRQRRLKEQIAKREKEADKDMIQRILEKEKELAELERDQKLKNRQEARKTLSGFRNKTQDMAGYERELDRLIQAERKKKEAKQDQEWRKREQARVKLLHDVYHDRERKVNEHFKEKEDELGMRDNEKIAVDEAVRRQNALEEEKRLKEAERNRIEQSKLLEEIRMKEERRRLLLLELQKEDNEITAARVEYDRNIQERKEKGRAELDQFKRSHRL